MSSVWLRMKLANQNEIASKFERMPLQSWGLSNRTLNALLSSNFKMTIGDVIRAGENLGSIKGLGEAGIEEIDDKISQMLADVARNSEAQSSMDSDQNLIAVTSLPELLPESVQTFSLDLLHLDTKTRNALIKAGITNIGELYGANADHLSGIQGFHSNSLGSINVAIITLLNSMKDENDVDWFHYWKAQGIPVLPPMSDSNTFSAQVIRELPQIIEGVLRRESSERAWLIIQRRFALGKAEKLTLEDMGSAFGLSRERVRQLEEKAIRKLREVLVEQHGAGTSYQVHPTIYFLIQKILNIIEMELGKLIIETKLFNYLRQTLDIDMREVSSSLFLIFALLKIEHIDFDYPYSVPAWGCVVPAQRRMLESKVKRIDDLLTHETPFPQAELDILVDLNKRAKKSEKLTLADLSILINLCNSVEKREDGSIWGKFEFLKGRGNQVERLLFESGVPMRITDLVREINHRLVTLGQRRIAKQNLVNQIIGDDRFVSIGRSGKWGLKSWTHIDTKNVLILMEECLITSNKPATIDEIYSYVSERRPVSKKSIITYLTMEKERFAKASLTTWGLTKWSDNTNSDAWDKEQIADFIAGIFRNNKVKELSYKMLKEALMKETGINASQAQGILNRNPVIKTRIATGSGERIAIFQSNYKVLLAQAKKQSPRKKISLRQQIAECVRDILKATPDEQMPMSELVHQLHKQLDCPESTLYACLSALDSIERIDVPNARTKICRLRETQGSASGRTLHQRVDESVRSILEATSDKQMLLSDLIISLRKRYNCPNSTLYQYISDLDYIVRLNIPNSRAKLCRMKDALRTDLFPQVQNIADSILREKVNRTLPFLTEENVDIGLFLLSKEFEATLKNYLTIASTKGKLTVLPSSKDPDKWSLNAMIDSARDNGIITDYATFHYLRQTRNDRAHGTMPSLEQRQTMMKYVQTIAGLYIDYIKILDNLSQNL